MKKSKAYVIFSCIIFMLFSAVSTSFGEKQNVEFLGNYLGNKNLASKSLDLTESASDTAGLDKELPSPWIEQTSKKQLNRLKTKLENLQKTYNENWVSFCVGECINRINSKNNQQKRNTTFLLDISRQQPFNIYALTCVFPELLRLYTENFAKYLLDQNNSLSDEIAESPEETEKIISQIAEKIACFQKINSAYGENALRAFEAVKALEKANDKIYNIENLGYFIKKTNAEILKLLSEQLESMKEINRQLGLAIEYSQKQLDYINYNSEKPTNIKCYYIAKVMGAFMSLEKFLENYDKKQELNSHYFDQSYRTRHKKLQSMIGKNEAVSKLIERQLKKVEFFAPSRKIASFSAEISLNQVFKLFAFEKVNDRLYKVILPYVSGESWQSRYKAPETIDKDNEIKKISR